MTVAEFLAIRWDQIEGPLIEPPRFSPIIADPSFLFPEETPDGAWELFAHSAWGIHRYSSPDGLAWRDRGLVVRNAMRPFIRRLPEQAGTQSTGSAGGSGGKSAGGSGGKSAGSDAASGKYYLYYEAYRPFALPLTALPLRPRWRSSLALSRSGNLETWSRPQTIVSPDLPWMKDARLGDSVSNPCLVKGGADAWRLYFSASLAWIPDCGFCEPRYIGAATGPGPEGPFSAAPAPLINPATDPMPGVLGAGAIKAIPLDNGWIGLQNKIYRGPDGRSRSAIFMLRSEDGFAWQPARVEPLIAPSVGWMASHVYACDCRFREKDGLWHLYFNARDAWKIKDGVERIGKLTGRAPD